MQIDKHKVKLSFGAAAPTYDQAAVVQKEILTRLLDSLGELVQSCETVLDLGSGTGMAINPIQKLFKPTTYCAMDLAQPMLQLSKSTHAGQESYVCGDAEYLPFATNSFDLIFSASTLQWCNNIETVYQDCFRILRPGGLLLFSTFGPDTLIELRDCFAQVDSADTHINNFVDMHNLGDCLVQQGFANAVMESDRLQIQYEQPLQLLKDLKATGAKNNRTDSAKGLFGKEALQSVLQKYQQYLLDNQKYPATYEVIYGHAWKLADNSAEIPPEQQWQPVTFK